MLIGLIRHFRVNCSSRKLVTSSEFVQWVHDYDNADVLIEPVENTDSMWDICFSSDLPRARRTAEKIYPCKPIISNLLKEALGHVLDWWGDDPNSKHNAIFVIQPATAEEIIAVAGKIKPEYEQLYAYKEIIFWSAPLKTLELSNFTQILRTFRAQSTIIDSQRQPSQSLARAYPPKDRILPIVYRARTVQSILHLYRKIWMRGGGRCIIFGAFFIIIDAAKSRHGDELGEIRHA